MIVAKKSWPHAAKASTSALSSWLRWGGIGVCINATPRPPGATSSSSPSLRLLEVPPMDAMVQIAQRVLNRGCGGCRPERGAYATPSWLDALRERHICCWHKPTAGLLLFADVDSTLAAHFARMRQVPYLTVRLHPCRWSRRHERRHRPDHASCRIKRSVSSPI